MSWKKCSLGEICSLVATGKTPPTERVEYFGGEIIWINPSDFLEKELRKSNRYITEEAVKNKKAVLLPHNSLLISCIGDIGKVGILRTCGSSNQQITAVKPISSVDVDFLYYQILAKKSDLIHLSNSSVVPILNSTSLKKLRITFPESLPTQQHIAAILDKADALRQQNRQLLAHYDELLQSTFMELFGDPVENPKGWEVKKLGEIAEVVSGVAKNSGITGDLIEAPYMRVANVQDGNLDLTEIKTISVYKRDFDKYQLKRNDILMTEGGDPDKLGRAAIWNEEVENCIHQNHIFRVRPDFSRINSGFLCNQFGSSYGKRYFLKAAKQTTGIASINMTQLKNFPALIPPVSVQRKFGEIAQEIESQKQQAQAALAESEALFQGLLAGYFGEN